MCRVQHQHFNSLYTIYSNIESAVNSSNHYFAPNNISHIKCSQEKSHAAAPVYATAYETPAVSGLSSPYETALSQTDIVNKRHGFMQTPCLRSA